MEVSTLTHLSCLLSLLQ